MSRKIPALADFRRIVVKVGSSLLVDSDGGRIHEEWLASLVADLAQLHGQQRDVMVVSSGAIYARPRGAEIARRAAQARG